MKTLRIELRELARIGERQPAAFYRMLEAGTLDGNGGLLIEEGRYHEALGLMRGAGDLVERVAKPIARAVDAVLGTDLAHCAGCAERRERWNETLPFQTVDGKR